jgi:hypothetical protein
MSKKAISTNFKGTEGEAVFTDTALQTFSARLRFSPDLTYLMPKQVCFTHKVTPYTFNGVTHNTVNSVLMVGVEENGDAADVKIVPVSHLTRMYYSKQDVDAVEKDGHVRGADKMLPASNIAEIIDMEGKAGRKTIVPVAYKINVARIYTPQITGDKESGYDFKAENGKLTLDPKDAALFTEVTFPETTNYLSAVPEELKVYLR